MKRFSTRLSCAGIALAVLLARAEPAKAADAGPAPTNATVMDSALPADVRLAAAIQLHGTDAITPEAAIWLLTDFIGIPDLPLASRVQAAEIAYQRSKANLVPVMAGFRADFTQLRRASEVTAVMAPGFLRTVFTLFIEFGPVEKRLEAATLLLEFEFSNAAWAGLSVASNVQEMRYFSSTALRIANESDVPLKAALARCMAMTKGAWGAEAARKLRSDTNPLVQAEMQKVPPEEAGTSVGKQAWGPVGRTGNFSIFADAPKPEEPPPRPRPPTAAKNLRSPSSRRASTCSGTWRNRSGSASRMPPAASTGPGSRKSWARPLSRGRGR